MSRYRKIQVRIWGDEKFQQLSPLLPSGQGLWLYLLTGPHTGPIPGLFRAGRAAMAEDLNWDLEAFDKAFQEAFRLGLAKADWKAKLMWIPNAIKHNRPESPNVVKSWSNQWDLLPECDLKWEAYEALKTSIGALGEAYLKAFQEAMPKPFGKTMANQEQEQEQEQYIKKKHSAFSDVREPENALPPPTLSAPGGAVHVQVSFHGDDALSGECGQTEFTGETPSLEGCIIEGDLPKTSSPHSSTLDESDTRIYFCLLPTPAIRQQG